MDSNWIVEQRRREVLSTQWALRAPMWELWHERRSAELWQVVALSLDYDPLYRFQHLSLVGVASTNPPPSPPSATRRQLASFETIELLERLRRDQFFVLRLESAVDHLGSGDAGERTRVSFHEFRQLAERFNWDLPEGFKLLAPTVVVPDAVAPTAEVMPVAPQPVQCHPAQEAAILEELRRLGLDPLALPAVQKGKASPEKAAVRAALPSLTKAVFDHAWKRLTGNKRIRYR